MINEQYVSFEIAKLLKKKGFNCGCISYYEHFSSDCIDITETINWLKSLKDRVQPKQEWSEEDNQYLCGLIGLIEQSKAEIPITLKGKAADNCIDWLKSLRPQNRWKPSAFYLECIEDAISLYEKRGINAIGLKEILDELKKLREE